MIFEIAHQMGLVPLVWLAWLHLRKRDPGIAWWWLAGAFFVSWLADTASHWVGHPMVSVTYPVSQAAIVGAVFLTRTNAMKFVLVLAAVGVADVLWRGVQGPDVLLRTVAWLSVAGIVSPIPQLGRLRTALLVYFALGWLAWMWYCLRPGWTSWSAYQITRLAGILLFCWAATDPSPHFKLIKK